MAHLKAPLPLERQRDLEQDGDDPRKVDVANDLKKRENRSAGLSIFN